MNENVATHAIGMPLSRLDAAAKVRGQAPYAYEQQVDRPTYLYPLQATIAKGRFVRLDKSEVQALDGVLVVMSPNDAPRLADTSDGELSVLQFTEIAFRGQFIGAVVAETPEIARHAASLITVTYDVDRQDTTFGADRDNLYAPERVNPGFATDTDEGDVDSAFAGAAMMIDQIYTTPMQHNNPMEPHTCVAVWDPHTDQPRLTLYDSTQGVHSVRSTLAPIFGLAPHQIRVVSPHVGGGFGSKGLPHAHNVLAVLAAQRTGGRPVKFALTRQQMFSLAGYRTPTIQRVRLGAERAGRIAGLCHEVLEQTSRIKEFAEQAAVPSRMMYAAPNRRTGHRLARLDVPVPSWMRAPGVCPGMFGPEVAIDELAQACGLDPIDVRARNDPRLDPETGLPWSGRHLLECLRLGAERFGWRRRTAPGGRRIGRRMVGLGVAASTYPQHLMTGSTAAVEYDDTGHYVVRIGAADLGTGTWTTLTQIAADALDRPPDAVRLHIGATDLPVATVAGGSSGISSWGTTIVAAARAFRDKHGTDPAPGDHATATTPENPDGDHFSLHSFGAQFAEVSVDADTGEVRVPRMLGVFSVGRIINPRTARSQFIGGMTMGLSMALHEEGVFDTNTGHVVNHDLAGYHIPTNADVGDLEAVWLDEQDPHANPMGARGIGEIGIVGAAAAIANAVYNATGIRVRDLPITPDKLVR